MKFILKLAADDSFSSQDRKHLLSFVSEWAEAHNVSLSPDCSQLAFPAVFSCSSDSSEKDLLSLLEPLTTELYNRRINMECELMGE